MDMNSAFYETNGVFIRTVGYLNSKDAALVGAFLSAKEKTIPVYYQYCQTKQPNDNQDTSEIGYATNFRIDEGMLVCDVHINQYSMFAHHFQGIIDNYTIRMRQDNNKLVMELVRLIIYNKTFKSERDKEILDQGYDCTLTLEDEESEYDQESLFDTEKED